MTRVGTWRVNDTVKQDQRVKPSFRDFLDYGGRSSSQFNAWCVEELEREGLRVLEKRLEDRRKAEIRILKDL